MTNVDYASLPHCGLLRRLGAIAYDSLLLGAVLILASGLALLVTGGETARPGNPFMTSYFFLVSFLFYAWFWMHGGQTLGMRAWRIRVQQLDGRNITPWQALLRFIMAVIAWLPFGLGFLWSLFDREQRTWHDRFSETVLVVIPKDL